MFFLLFWMMDSRYVFLYFFEDGFSIWYCEWCIIDMLFWMMYSRQVILGNGFSIGFLVVSRYCFFLCEGISIYCSCSSVSFWNSIPFWPKWRSIAWLQNRNTCTNPRRFIFFLFQNIQGNVLRMQIFAFPPLFKKQ